MASRALFSGYAGTSAHQARMDVLANNLANTNTVGFVDYVARKQRKVHKHK